MPSSVHPFPARMAPELALGSLKSLPRNSIVLDPMAGSGTVLRQALDLGLGAIGFDVDPLAVLMATVWTTPVNDNEIAGLGSYVMSEVEKLSADDISLPWIDTDEEACRFIFYWFGEKQRNDLRRISFVLDRLAGSSSSDFERASLNVIRLNLSRIIVTKEAGASLARDTSHSRPHRVTLSSDYDVKVGFERSLRVLRKRLADEPPVHGAQVKVGDARKLDGLDDGCVDAVLTSPPYLNAIDYMRGHRLALVWLGERLSDLRAIRSSSIGSERAPDTADRQQRRGEVARSMADPDRLPTRYVGMIQRYAGDLLEMMTEVARVLRPGGQATFVVGNSCIKDVFIRNSDGLISAALLSGLKLDNTIERDLPAGNRYLPLSDGALSKRMRKEIIVRFNRQ